MTEYHKIDAPFKRDKRGKFMLDTYGNPEWCRPEFEYLARLDWEFTEKVDGTNIRLIFTRDDAYMQIGYGGRTDNAQIPPALLGALNAIVDNAAESIHQVMVDRDIDKMVVYGEGYGPKINGGGKYTDHPDFVVFDIKVGDWWLTRQAVNDFCAQTGLDAVPVIGTGTLYDAIDLVRFGCTKPKSMHGKTLGSYNKDLEFKSAWGDFQAEGVIAVPVVPLFNRQGNRIITKIKCVDFK